MAIRLGYTSNTHIISRVLIGGGIIFLIIAYFKLRVEKKYR
jgi:hypothetical protein